MSNEYAKYYAESESTVLKNVAVYRSVSRWFAKTQVEKKNWSFGSLSYLSVLLIPENEHKRYRRSGNK
jgi:hypothetical protein